MEVVCIAKYLGVQINENLIWKNQITSVTDKTYASHIVPDTVVTALHTSIVEPHFQYCALFGADQ